MLNAIEHELRLVWDQLRGKKKHLPYFLEEISLENIRVFRKRVKIKFDYPVSVIAGENGSGKTTLLMAAACAYDDPKGRIYPSTVFPRFYPKEENFPKDQFMKTVIEFTYTHDGRILLMSWKQGKDGRWNRSFFGRKKASWPKRRVYLRTLAQLTHPSEIRKYLTLAQKKDIRIDHIDPYLISMAERVLEISYEEVLKISRENAQGRGLLFAKLPDETEYSEFHMAAGERSILWLSMILSDPEMENALVLIDEIENSLHPYVQKKLMLELQRLALRRSLQFIITTHSPIILDAVPAEGRIILQRKEGGAEVIPPFIDLIERALYGQTERKLKILCEDRISAQIVRGVLDVLIPKLRIAHEDIEIGHDTGKSEFKHYFSTISKFGMVREFVFVLDGDAREVAAELKANSPLANVLLLPGQGAPEEWILDTIRKNASDYARLIPVESEEVLNRYLNRVEAIYASSTGDRRIIVKEKYRTFASYISLSEEQLARVVARHELEKHRGDIVRFAEELENAISSWRSPEPSSL